MSEYDPNKVPQDMVDAIVEAKAPVARKLVAMKHGITEEQVITEINEEEGEGTPVTRDYWELLDEFIKEAWNA